MSTAAIIATHACRTLARTLPPLTAALPRQVTEAHLITGLVHQLVAAEHAHTFAETEALQPLLPQHLGEVGSRLSASLTAEDNNINTLMHALQNARPETDFIAWKVALAK